MGKLGRKVCCNYKKDVKCIMLVNGKKLCYFDETTEKQFSERHELQFVFCPLFPESEKVEWMASLKAEGWGSKRFIDARIPTPYDSDATVK